MRAKESVASVASIKYCPQTKVKQKRAVRAASMKARDTLTINAR
jgi:hypothetical protein